MAYKENTSLYSWWIDPFFNRGKHFLFRATQQLCICVQLLMTARLAKASYCGFTTDFFLETGCPGFPFNTSAQVLLLNSLSSRAFACRKNCALLEYQFASVLLIKAQDGWGLDLCCPERDQAKACGSTKGLVPRNGFCDPESTYSEEQSKPPPACQPQPGGPGLEEFQLLL